MKLSFKKYSQEGDLANEYNPLHNLVDNDGLLHDFKTDELAMDLTHPLQIDCQPSYDGTVNLIINDDKNPPRIINSRFTKIENGRYRIITRNQRKQTNLYEIGKIDQQTRLFRTLNTTSKLQLYSVGYHGQLKGGNYTFYVKFGDEDTNKTDIVAESGVVSIFSGTEGSPKTICGTLSDERTNKSIKLLLKNIDTSFSNIYLYCVRSTSDLQGFRTDEVIEFIKPYKITSDEMKLTITGFEDTNTLTEDDLNIKYLSASAVKTQTQVQNRLFFGNIEAPTPDNTNLQNLSYYIRVECTQEADDNNTLGYVDLDYKTGNNSANNGEYYNAQNIYYRLGYWPEEIYRLGIVYIMNDDTLSDVYNLRGCDFEKSVDADGKYYNISEEESLNVVKIPKEDFINLGKLENTYGVFKNPRLEVIQQNKVAPIFYKASLNNYIIKELKKYKVKGFFLVRQKRIPTTIAQGLEIGINPSCYTPMIWNGTTYIGESFKSSNNVLTTNLTARTLKSKAKQSSALICVDAIVNPSLRSNFNGQKFTLTKAYEATNPTVSNRRYKYHYDNNNDKFSYTSRLLYVDKDIPAKVLDDYCFSTRAGNAESVSDLAFWDSPGRAVYTSKTPKLVRGVFSPIIGTDANLSNGDVYNIKIAGYNDSFEKEYFDIRGNDNAAFMAITDRYSIYDELDNSGEISVNAYRGDCFINTVTVRIDRNFTDPDVPIDDIIVDEDTWKTNYKGYYGAVYTNGREGSGDKQIDALKGIEDAIKDGKSKDDNKNTKFYKINRADTNAVPIGMWVTYKCLSNYNLSLRAVDKQNVEEYAIMGNPRTFYPYSGISTKSAYKMPETELLNDGYCSTVGKRINFKFADVPYIKDQFDNRIMFSNIQVDDEFRNSYRIFQGLSYQDIDRQYGSIVKLMPWYSSGTMNLLAVFEHGIGIVPVNEKALVSTTTDQSIHMYGSGVLQRDVTVVSPDFGSTWIDSIIKTPLAIYGVDTYAKKIWRVPLGGGGIESISDIHIQQFLNDHMTFKESDKSPIIALRNVKTHYNNYKGDVMFTFYDYEHNEEWNFCYNERTQIWTTRYTWTPLFSENINNCYYSFDKKRSEILAYIDQNINCEEGIITDNHSYISGDFKTNVTLVGHSSFKDCEIKTSSIKTIYFDNGYETKETIFKSDSVNNLTIPEQYLSTKDNILYWLVLVEITPFREGVKSISFNSVIAIKNNNANELYMRNGIYVHGRSGVYDEIIYTDENMENQILSTKWYGKQEPFELEFVVTQPTGLHKIFDNLVIISNKVKPEEIEFEIIGDVYNFNKAGLYWNTSRCTDAILTDHEFDTKYNPEKYSIIQGANVAYQISQEFKNADIIWDNHLNTYSLKINQKCKDLLDPKYGRLHGNIHYKEDSWKLTIEPIQYYPKYKIGDILNKDTVLKETKIRDKYCKVRVKYSGTEQAIITSIKTLLTLSYS